MPCRRCDSEVVTRDGITQLGGQRIRSSHGLCRGALGRAGLGFGNEHGEGGAAAKPFQLSGRV